MSGRLFIRRGPAASEAIFVGATGELSIDSTNWRPAVHDGVTPGGHPFAKLADLNPLGVNTQPDTTNKLAVRSNASLFTAIYAADGGNGDMQIKVNKETVNDTGSFLFQRNFSGRAEIGNTGDDNFHFKVSSDGSTFHEALILAAGSGLVSLPVGQLKFPAIQNPSSDANTLDDYEEGTFTPALFFGGLGTGIVYSTRTGTYTKIGNRVFADCYFILSNKGTATGVAAIGSLPFPQNAGLNGSLTLSFYASMAGLTGGICGFQAASSTSGQLWQSTATGLATVTDANFTNTTRIDAHFDYFV